MIVILDYGMGNVRSVHNMLKKVGYPSIITSDKQTVLQADKYILPGIGAFDFGIRNLRNAPCFDILKNAVLNDRKPILGICLGMQLLTNGSDEGSDGGLGWIDAYTKKFNFDDMNDKLPIPHMGWNHIKFTDDTTLFKGFNHNNRFYFVHSFYVSCSNKEDVLATSYYGEEFASSIYKENIFGVQFHPEKSHKYGMQLLKNFGDL